MLCVLLVYFYFTIRFCYFFHFIFEKKYWIYELNLSYLFYALTIGFLRGFFFIKNKHRALAYYYLLIISKFFVFIGSIIIEFSIFIRVAVVAMFFKNLKYFLLLFVLYTYRALQYIFTTHFDRSFSYSFNFFLPQLLKIEFIFFVNIKIVLLLLLLLILLSTLILLFKNFDTTNFFDFFVFFFFLIKLSLLSTSFYDLFIFLFFVKKLFYLFLTHISSLRHLF